ncbi:MAG: asparagine synthase (glutamine-hydrolyzing) [Gammaproteobacteria bacterium]|nr:asparagine synthase (glutamine-hydrolyzing) [Gammaproteobacteria bacterium]
MCGISGIYAQHINEKHFSLIEKIIQSQRNRGPDHQAHLFIKGNQAQTILGHNRLSIIDLSNHANQPMWDPNERYCITYNGEIYNYVELRDALHKAGFSFNTQSDTEVILQAFAAWGIDALNRFQGPFAFALFDKKTNTLWLCRDRFGVRPLFYLIRNNILYFASSTRVLAKAFNTSPNLNYIARGLKYCVYEDDTQATPYENIFSLPAGSYLQAQINETGTLETKIHFYYDLGERAKSLSHEIADLNTDNMLQRILETFEHAVKLRLRSDVPFGISLSGGLDSSSVAALVSQQHKNTIGFSYAHPAHKKSEGPIVQQCADYLGLKIEYIWPDPSEMLTGVFETIEAQDAPFSSLSIVAQFLLYKHIKSHGIKVILGGQGGDEAFMGYRKYLLFWLKQTLREKRYLSFSTKLFQLLPLFSSEISTFPTYWRHRNRYFKGNGLQHTLQLPTPSVLKLRLDKDQSLRERQIEDITKFSLPTLLRYEDRNAMAHSVESRLPFLDYQLIELGAALPEAIKLRYCTSKWPIRKIMQNKMPDNIVWAKYKRGFDLSLNTLLNLGLGKSIRYALHERKETANHFLQSHLTIDSAFSDAALRNRQSAIAEAMTLLWLNSTG